MKDTMGPIGLLYYSGIVSASGDTTAIVAPGAGKRVVISDVIVQNESTAEVTCLVKNGATTIKRLLMTSKGNGVAWAFAAGREWRLSEDTALIVNLSSANSVGISFSYFLESLT